MKSESWIRQEYSRICHPENDCYDFVNTEIVHACTCFVFCCILKGSYNYGLAVKKYGNIFVPKLWHPYASLCLTVLELSVSIPSI